MNKLVKFFALGLILLPVVGCGESKSADSQETQQSESVIPETVRVKDVNVQGNLSDYYQVVDKEYEFPARTSLLGVEFKRTSQADIPRYDEICMGYKFYDADGNVVVEIPETHIAYTSGINEVWLSASEGDVVEGAQTIAPAIMSEEISFPESFAGVVSFTVTLSGK